MLFRRKKILTHQKLQLHFAGTFFLWSLVFVSLMGFILLMNFQAMAKRVEMLEPAQKVMTKFFLFEQGNLLFIYYGLAALAYILLLMGYLVVYSHRFTGPIYKLSQTLEDSITKRELPEKLVFRKHDAFQELAEQFNAFVELSKQIGEEKKKGSSS